MKQLGLNLACASLTGERRELDFYPTPPSATRALIARLSIPICERIWEPACGDGAISQVFTAHNYIVESTDIADHGFGLPDIDFLKETESRGDWIVTNPPFSLSEKFIVKALKLKPKGVAMLFKSQYWHAEKRLKLFQLHPPAYILPLTWRLDFAEKGSPLMECLWTVWIEGVKITRYELLRRGEYAPDR